MDSVLDRPSVTDAELRAWLEGPAWQMEDPRELVDRWIRLLLDAGVPLLRTNIAIGTLHPELIGFGYVWTREGGTTEEQSGSREVFLTGGYEESPYKLIMEDGMRCIRRRLDRDGPDDFGILPDLRAMGATDYVVLAEPIRHITGVIGTWASDQPDGLAPAQINLLSHAFTWLRRLLEPIALTRLSINLLDTYVGPRAGERILMGEILRGSGESQDAVIWFSDLRGFTRLSDDLPRDTLIALLNAHFDAFAQPIQAAGGEILKFMGDGVLAMFPTDGPAGVAGAGLAAVAAADGAIANMADLNAARGETGDPPLGFAIALHLGEVSFGNVGASNRLDFTAIGPAVNIVHRIERLAVELSAPVLVSASVAHHLGDRAESRGRHELRGHASLEEVFALTDR